MKACRPARLPRNSTTGSEVRFVTGLTGSMSLASGSFRTFVWFDVHANMIGCSSATVLKSLHHSKAISSLCSSKQRRFDFVCLKHAPSDFPHDSAVVYSDAITISESNALIDHIQTKLKRKRYQKGHWDGVISAYREVELDLSGDFVELDQSCVNLCTGVIGRIRRYLEKTHGCSDNKTAAEEQISHQSTRTVKWLPCHAIDLRKDGVLSPHVDSVRFSGDIVCGLSLQSPSIMRLKPDDTQSVHHHVDLYLPPLSLYVLSGVSRYKYTHELLPSGELFHFGQNEELKVDRQDRISIIFRDAPHQNSPTDDLDQKKL